jgi:hypothetical protein
LLDPPPDKAILNRPDAEPHILEKIALPMMCVGVIYPRIGDIVGGRRCRRRPRRGRKNNVELGLATVNPLWPPDAQ